MNCFSKRKVFISLPMSGRKEEEIREDILTAEEWYLDATGTTRDEVWFFNNLDGGKTAVDFERDLAEEHDANWIAPKKEKMGLWYLGIAMNNLAYCDEAIFWGDWKNARGCRMEHEACLEYGIKTIPIYKI